MCLRVPLCLCLGFPLCLCVSPSRNPSSSHPNPSISPGWQGGAAAGALQPAQHHRWYVCGHHACCVAHHVPTEDAESRPPINVKFEIPYFTTSGIQVRPTTQMLLLISTMIPSSLRISHVLPRHSLLLVPLPRSTHAQVRYLKIIEKSGYQALPWVRYITQNGGVYGVPPTCALIMLGRLPDPHVVVMSVCVLLIGESDAGSTRFSVRRIWVWTASSPSAPSACRPRPSMHRCVCMHLPRVCAVSNAAPGGIPRCRGAVPGYRAQPPAARGEHVHDGHGAVRP